MKKTIQRLVAAAVAIPVALSQVLAVSVNAAETQQTYTVSLDNLLAVNPATGFPTDVDTESDSISFTQESTWNETLAERLGTVNAENVSVDIKSVLAGFDSQNFFINLLKDVVTASGNPTATIADGVVTITGVADMSAYMGSELQDKLDELGGYDVTIDTSILEDVSYVITITTDLANSKSASASMVITANGQEYTLNTLSNYMNAVYDNLAAQINQAVENKAQALADEYGISIEEALEMMTVDLTELESVTSKYQNQLNLFEEKLEYFQNLTTANPAVKEFDTADDVIETLVNYLERQGLQSAANMPTTVDGMIARYGSILDNTIATMNGVLTDAGTNVQLAVSSADVATMLKEGSAFKASAVNGDYTIQFTAADAQYDQVVDYVEAQVAEVYGSEKVVDEVTTEKIVTVEADMNGGTISYDVVRNVTVTLTEPSTTETTTSTDETGTETTTTEATGTGSDVTTASTEGTGDGSETTTTEATGTGSDVTTASTEGTGDGSETSTTESTGTETTASDTTGTGTETTETLPVDVDSISVELLDADASNGIYFSEEESFNPADLIASVVLTLSDGTEMTVDASALSFAQTPAEVYATVDTEAGAGNVYFQGEVDLIYTANPDVAVDTQATVAVAMKGDTNLDGEVDTNDAFYVLQYYAAVRAGQEAPPIAGIDTSDNPLLQKLLYYVSDINTESKLGADSDDAVLDTYDAFWQLQYYSQHSAGNVDITWDEVLESTPVV